MLLEGVLQMLQPADLMNRHSTLGTRTSAARTPFARRVNQKSAVGHAHATLHHVSQNALADGALRTILDTHNGSHRMSVSVNRVKVYA